MIIGVYGEGGTGKSAITVAMALDHLGRYDIIYTNIKGFNKNHSIQDIAKLLDADIQIREFEHNGFSFNSVLEEIEEIQQKNSNDDKFKILVIYDECHKSLRRYTHNKPEDVAISDFLSEHRHFHCDMYFMTQGYKKIADMYKGDFKAWYASVDDQFKANPNEIMFKKMDRENKTKIGVKRFKKTKKWKGYSGNLYSVFDCYDSGDSGEKQQKQGISFFAKKKYFFIAVLFIAICSLIYAFSSVSSLFDDGSSGFEDNSVSALTVFSNTQEDKNTSYSDRFEILDKHKDKNSLLSSFVIISCLYDVQKDIYLFPNRSLTKENFKTLNDLYLFELIGVQLLSQNVFKYEFLVNEEIAPALDKRFTKKKKGTF